MSTVVARLEAVLSANTRDFDRGMDKSETKMHKVGKAAGVAGLAIAGGLAVGLTKSVHAALNAEVSQNRLEQAFKNAHLAISPYTKAIEDAEKAGRKLGFTDEATKTALGSLITATGSYKKAVDELSVAQDVSRFKHVELADATKMLTMAQTGSQRAAKQLGISVSAVTTAYDALGKNATSTEKAQAKLTDKMATGDAVIQAVREHVSGQADAYSKTAAGGMEQFRAQLDHLEVAMGKGLLPILTQVSTTLATATDFFVRHTTATKILIGSLAALAVTLITVSVSAKIAAAAMAIATAATKLYELWVLRAEYAQVLFNVAIRANPYIAAATAIAVMSAALFVLWERSQRARTIIEIVTGVITMGLSVAIIEAVRHWGGLTGAMGTAAGAMTGAVLDAIHGVSSAIRHLVEWLKDAVGYVKSLIGWLGKIPSIHIGLPHIPGPWGDASGSGSSTYSARAAAEGKAFNVGRQLWDEIGMGEMAGLHVTSGYRPGATTKHGTPSDHGYNPSRAVDMSGSAGGMASLFKALIGRTEVRQAFYDPLGSIFNGIRSSYREGGHSDHIHIAEYAQGGIVTKPTLGLVGEAGPEAIIPLSKNWKDNFDAFLSKVWSVAGPYYGGGAMPNARFMSQQYSGGRSYTDIWGKHGALAIGKRTVEFSQQVWDGVRGALGPYFKQLGLNTILHEWVHARQLASVFKSKPMTEGGAAAFPHLLGKAIYSKLGIDYDPATGMGNPYEQWATQLLKQKGSRWITKGQFGLFDNGGWLQPGATLALNNTGRPERVGGGNVTIPISIGGEHIATVIFDQLRGKAKMYERRNNRPAFGT
jgi:hypothetical protein